VELKDFKNMDAKSKQLIGQLNAAECIADAGDKKAVEQIMAEIAVEKKRAEREKQAHAAGSSLDVAKQLADALRTLAQPVKA